MSKLTKFLSENTIFMTKNESGSYYFKINERTIRVSSHLPKLQKFNVLSILIPQDSRTQYIVSLSDSLFVYNSFTELKSFLISWIRIIKAEEFKKTYVESMKCITLQAELNKLNSEVIKIALENELLKFNYTPKQILALKKLSNLKSIKITSETFKKQNI